MKQTAVEWMQNTLWKEYEIELPIEVIEQAKQMEKKQREKEFLEGYKKRAELSCLIFDESSELFAKSLFEKKSNL